jgi:hypothetical protein
LLWLSKQLFFLFDGAEIKPVTLHLLMLYHWMRSLTPTVHFLELPSALGMQVGADFTPLQVPWQPGRPGRSWCGGEPGHSPTLDLSIYPLEQWSWAKQLLSQRE